MYNNGPVTASSFSFQKRTAVPIKEAVAAFLLYFQSPLAVFLDFNSFPNILRPEFPLCSTHAYGILCGQRQSLAKAAPAKDGNVKKCAVGKHPKSEKHGNTAQFSEVERSGTQENCGGIGSGCRLRLRPLPVLHRRQSQRVARIDPNAVVVDKNIAENDRFDLFSR